MRHTILGAGGSIGNALIHKLLEKGAVRAEIANHLEVEMAKGNILAIIARDAKLYRHYGSQN